MSECNKINIVTFNYDKILEYVLEKQFSNTEAPNSHYSDYIKIMHVHGECGDMTVQSRFPPAQICLNWANGIHVINETEVPTVINSTRSAAREAIQSARELYFCGFSFSGPNCRLLGLEAPNDGLGSRVISFHNYDGNVGISKSMKKFEKPYDYAVRNAPHNVSTVVEEANGSPDRPLMVVDWLRSGYLGELPG